MATLKGLQVYGREIEPGDQIMNEWSLTLLLVERVSLIHEKGVKLHCVSKDGRREVLEGDWNSVTRLITRSIPAFELEG